MRRFFLVGLFLAVSAAPARSDPAAPEAMGLWAGRAPSGAYTTLRLRPDHRVELTVDRVPYAGRWTETAGVRCVRLWSDEAPDVGCVLEAREGSRGFLVNEQREVVLALERTGPSAIELPLSRW